MAAITLFNAMKACVESDAFTIIDGNSDCNVYFVDKAGIEHHVDELPEGVVYYPEVEGRRRPKGTRVLYAGDKSLIHYVEVCFEKVVIEGFKGSINVVLKCYNDGTKEEPVYAGVFHRIDVDGMVSHADIKVAFKQLVAKGCVYLEECDKLVDTKAVKVVTNKKATNKKATNKKNAADAPAGKVLNPATNRWVDINGAIGRRIIKASA